MRKIDLWLIPWLCLLYLLSFLDRTNIGNARLAGMEKDLGMEGNDYNKTLVRVDTWRWAFAIQTLTLERPFSSFPTP